MVLCLGAERDGLPAEIVAAPPSMAARIPLRPDGPESLNVAAAAAVALYEARELGWPAMPDAPARLEELRREAEAAIAAARSSAELEELRVRYLGRKAELTGILRSIGELPPEQRGPVGKAANEVKRALEAPARRAHGRRSRRASSTGGWPRTGST